jgi:hypothetical protein
VDGNCRYESRNKEPEKANSDRKCARQRLRREEITVTNREAGNESEIDRIPEPSTKNQSASPGQAESLELPTTPATSREWHGRAPRKSAAATFSVSAGSCRDDLRKRSASSFAKLSPQQ